MKKISWSLILYSTLLFASVLVAAYNFDLIGNIKINTFLGSLTSPGISDPQNLADSQHVLFVDKNNPNCSNSNTRSQALNPDTPWCDSSAFGGEQPPGLNLFQPGDRILFKAGTYGALHINGNGSAGNYISFQNYPGDNVIFDPSTIYPGWTDLGNGIYKKTFVASSFAISRLQAVKTNSYGISKLKTLNDLNNPPTTISSQTTAAQNDLLFVDTSTNDVYLRLVSGSPSDVHFAFNPGIEIQGSYIEIKGLKVQYGYDCITANNSYSDHLRFVNNTLSYCDGQGILADRTNDLYVDGNTIDYVGVPLEYKVGTSIMQANNKSHALYIGGDGGIIKNNRLSHCWYYCMGIGSGWHPTMNYSVYNNYVDNGTDVSGYSSSNYAQNIVVFNNILKGDTQGGALALLSNISDLKVYNNLIIGYDDAETAISTSVGLSSSRNVDIKNNIVFWPSSYCIEIPIGMDYSKFKLDYNLYKCGYFDVDVDYGANSNERFFNNFPAYQTFMETRGSESHSIFGDPLLNSDNANVSSSSPAIGTGTCLSEITTDYYGNLRPATSGCDIGPFQHAGSTPVNPNPSTYCGDSTCNGAETCNSCYADCGGCPNVPPDTNNPQSAPIDLKATLDTYNQIHLSWSIPSSLTGIVGYYVYRCQGASCTPTNLINSVRPPLYVDSTISMDTTYVYGVKAYNSSGLASPMSEVVSIKSSATPTITPTITPPTTPTVTPATTSATYTKVFSKPLYLKVRDPEVSKLQQLLAKYPDIYPEAKVTGYYWTLTYKAVCRFQLKYGIVSKSTSPGYGLVGIKTRAKLNDIYNGK